MRTFVFVSFVVKTKNNLIVYVLMTINCLFSYKFFFLRQAIGDIVL